MTRLIRIGAVVYLASQAIDAARLCYANRLAASGQPAAAAVDPRNAAYRADPGEAAALSPRDASWRMRLGLSLEEAGRTEEGERELLAAAKASRKYEPRWTLAGFYFRQNKIEPFWFWSKAALQMAYADPEPLFDLAWALENDGAEIRRRLQPESRPLVWRAWVRHASRHGHLDELEAVLDKLQGIDPEPLAAALAAGGRVGALTRLPGHHALDWQAIAQEGVTFEAGGHGGGFALRFDGREPEQCDVAWRLMPRPGRVDWHINGPVKGLAWRGEPFGIDGTRVILRYERPAGETRAVGSVRIPE